jgi:uncharacterized protein (TIGR03086 family)
MAGQVRGSGAAGAPSGATALLASAISYALGACRQVASAEMALPTPCADWDLEALLAHLAASMADLESALRSGHLDLYPNEPDPAAPGFDSDPAEVVRDQAANLLFACYSHHGADRFVRVGGLPLPAGLVACAGAIEIAVHGWDVSAARGHGDPIPPALAARMLRLSPLLVTGREGLFGAPVPVPAQASPGDRLVAYLGRIPIPLGPPE